MKDILIFPLLVLREHFCLTLFPLCCLALDTLLVVSYFVISLCLSLYTVLNYSLYLFNMTALLALGTIHRKSEDSHCLQYANKLYAPDFSDMVGTYEGQTSDEYNR